MWHLFFSFFFVFCLPFIVLRVPLPFSYCLSVVSFFLVFLLSPSLLYFSLPSFPWWRILIFCYIVSVLHPPRVGCAPEACVFPLPSVFFLAFLLLIYFIFLLFIPFFRFRFGHRLFHPFCPMLSPRFRILLPLV